MDMQYSAASFIETINTNSLSMDADEFVARMVAAGVPDMQLLPQPGPPTAPKLQTIPSGQPAGACAAWQLTAPGLKAVKGIRSEQALALPAWQVGCCMLCTFSIQTYWLSLPSAAMLASSMMRWLEYYRMLVLYLLQLHALACTVLHTPGCIWNRVSALLLSLHSKWWQNHLQVECQPVSSKCA